MWNRRGSSPLIWPPKMKVPLNSWPMLAQVLGVALMHFAQRIAHHARGIEHVGALKRRVLSSGCRRWPRSRLITAWVIARLPADISTSTRSRGVLERGHFAKRIDLIDAGVGSGVRQHHETGVDQHADAVSHGGNSTQAPRLRRRTTVAARPTPPPARRLPFSRRRRPGARRAPAPHPGSRGRRPGGNVAAPAGRAWVTSMLSQADFRRRARHPPTHGSRRRWHPPVYSSRSRSAPECRPRGSRQ